MSYPTVYTVELDPHEDLNLGGNFVWAKSPALKTVIAYEKSLKN